MPANQLHVPVPRNEGESMTRYTPETAAKLIGELRGFAAGSDSARATLMRDAADALAAVSAERDEAIREMHARELHHFEEEQKSAGLEAVIAEALAHAPRLGDQTWRAADRMIGSLRRAPKSALEARDARMKAEVLREFADAVRMPATSFYDGDGPITANDLLRQRAAAIEKEAGL